MRAELYVNDIVMYKVQVDLFNDGAFLDFWVNGMWISGDILRPHLLANDTDRSIYKQLAMELINRRAGPAYARRALETFVDGL